MILIRWIALSTLWTTVARTTNYMKTSPWELLSYAIQEYQALEACVLGPTIAVGFSELIVRLNLQFSVNSYLVTRLLIGMDLGLFHSLFVTTKGAWFFSIGFKRYIKSHFSAYMWREKNTLKLVLSIMFLSFPISSVTSEWCRFDPTSSSSPALFALWLAIKGQRETRGPGNLPRGPLEEERDLFTIYIGKPVG